MRAAAWAVWTVGLASGCGPGFNGGGGDVPGSGSVEGRTSAGDFTFVPARVGAFLETRADGTLELSILLCETDCPLLGGVPDGSATRNLSLVARGATTDLRIGGTFLVPGQALGQAQHLQGGSSQVDDASSGEVVIAASDLRAGGSTSGTFQLRMSSGGSVRGFFDAPIVQVTGAAEALVGHRRTFAPAGGLLLCSGS